jgi:hypothetical protein
MISYQEALTDAFLSEVRYGGKYLISHTEGRHDQLVQFKKDFVNYLEVLKRLGQSESTLSSLSEIERLHGQYHELFDREVAYIRANQNYAQSRYQQERDKIVESTLNELDLLKTQLRTELQNKLETIDHGASTAGRIALAAMLVVLVLGTVISLTVSRSVDGRAKEPTAGRPLTGERWADPKQVISKSLADPMQSWAKREVRRLTALREILMTGRSRRSVPSKDTTLGKGS